ncbi:hybrid sensor histidine kinase/response regulator [Mariprofundus ferrooxydans]|nr:ATP-binding protein [Mariprofundus ferrooxydans]
MRLFSTRGKTRNTINSVMLFTLITGLCEAIIMLVYSALGIEGTLSAGYAALLDATLLALLSFYPLCRFVFAPLFLEHKQLQNTEQIMISAFNSTQEGMLITDSNSTIIYVNSAFTEISGYSAADAIGKKPNILSSGRQSRAFYQQMWGELLEKGHWKGKLWNRRKTGEIYHEGIQITRIYGHFDEDYFIAVFSDISEQDELEASLAEARKMEALATLVGGVAHNFNNYLAGIMGRVFLAKKADSLPKVAKQLEAIEQAGRSATALVSELMVFSRDVSLDESHCDLAKIVKRATKTARLVLPETIKLKLDIADTPLPIFGNKSQIEQIILNMINNAHDACMQQEGVSPLIHIEAGRRQWNQCKDKFACTKRNECPLCYETGVFFSISDNGQGIPEDIIAKIFEPFFTTKEPGQGTGLGLSTAYQAVNRHGGMMLVDSSETEGSTFTVCLPLDESYTANTKEQAHIPMQGKGEKILLVDDEDAVREVTAEALRGYNYRVVTAANGAQALEAFASHRDDLAIVISDVVMPKMNGDIAVAKMRSEKPGLPVIFTSGYSDISPPDEDCTQFIRKPFSPPELSTHIHQLLSRCRTTTDQAMQPSN